VPKIVVRVHTVDRGVHNRYEGIIEGEVEIGENEKIIKIERPNPFKKFYVFTTEEIHA